MDEDRADIAAPHRRMSPSNRAEMAEDLLRQYEVDAIDMSPRLAIKGTLREEEQGGTMIEGDPMIDLPSLEEVIVEGNHRSRLG